MKDRSAIVRVPFLFAWLFAFYGRLVEKYLFKRDNKVLRAIDYFLSFFSGFPVSPKAMDRDILERAIEVEDNKAIITTLIHNLSGATFGVTTTLVVGEEFNIFEVPDVVDLVRDITGLIQFPLALFTEMMLQQYE